MGQTFLSAARDVGAASTLGRPHDGPTAARMDPNQPPLDYAPPRQPRSRRSWRLRRALQSLAAAAAFFFASGLTLAYAWLKTPAPNPSGKQGIDGYSILGSLLALVAFGFSLLTFGWFIDWLSAARDD